MVKLDLFESKLLVSAQNRRIHDCTDINYKTMATFTARKVLRELSESMIPLLDDEAYWPLAERIISCHGTLLTTSATSHDDDALVESMDIIEDELDTRQEEDLIVMENLGLKRPQRPKGINLLDLPIGSIGTFEMHLSRCAKANAVVMTNFRLTKDPWSVARRALRWFTSAVLETSISRRFVSEMFEQD